MNEHPIIAAKISLRGEIITEPSAGPHRTSGPVGCVQPTGPDDTYVRLVWPWLDWTHPYIMYSSNKLFIETLSAQASETSNKRRTGVKKASFRSAWQAMAKMAAKKPAAKLLVMKPTAAKQLVKKPAASAQKKPAAKTSAKEAWLQSPEMQKNHVVPVSTQGITEVTIEMNMAERFQEAMLPQVSLFRIRRRLQTVQNVLDTTILRSSSFGLQEHPIRAGVRRPSGLRRGVVT